MAEKEKLVKAFFGTYKPKEANVQKLKIYLNKIKNES
jgi:hypothetical protein